MLFLIPHLFPPSRLLEAAAQDLVLPALQTLLARGTRMHCPDEGTEAALCEALGIARQQDWPLAPITLAADGGAGDGYWLRADPVHLRVMRDRIVLADSSVFTLSQQEADALVASISQHFGDVLHPLPLHPTRWYLHFPHPPHLRTTPLSVASGRDIHPLLPQGDAAGPMRVVLNELQMLLYEHPVNQAREARGELPVNSVWLWGGGSVPVTPATGRGLYTWDATARALGAFCGSGVYPLPPHLEPAMLRTAGIVLLDDLTPAGQCGDAYGWREAMRGLEQNWFVPLLAALRTLDSSGLRLLDPVNGKGLHLHATDAWKIWRRPRSLALALA
ncbi:MAG: hypothetical protein Q8K62_09465 [Thiobacillus sp.]|nr:hypothetical protein [Thiobacillus sp.]